MQLKQKRQRPNQKIKRRAHRDAGIFQLKLGGGVRVVDLHPTKGFFEHRGGYDAAMLAEAQKQKLGFKLNHGKRTKVMQPVVSNAPKVYHNKSG